MNRKALAMVAALVYLASVILANWLTTRYGRQPVGFGLRAPAGTFAIAGALVVRDVLQDAAGRLGVVALIAVAAALSWMVAAPQIALASAAAFLLSEALDMLAYTPLRRRARFGDRWWRWAVLAGGAVGALADSYVFLRLAFGPAAVRPYLPGQMVGKLEIVALFILAGALVGAVRERQGRRPAIA